MPYTKNNVLSTPNLRAIINAALLTGGGEPVPLSVPLEGLVMQFCERYSTVRVTAIKNVRGVTGHGLKDAKEFVESLLELGKQLAVVVPTQSFRVDRDIANFHMANIKRDLNDGMCDSLTLRNARNLLSVLGKMRHDKKLC